MAGTGRCGSDHMKIIKLFSVFFCIVLTFAFMRIIADAVNTQTFYLRGDADGNGYVSISDVTAIQRHLAQFEDLSKVDLLAADVDGNGLDISDATKLQRYIAEFDDPCRIGEWITVDATEPATQASSVYIKPGDNVLPFV